MKKLEQRFKEFTFEVVEEDKKTIHRVIYQTNGDLIRNGVYELFVSFYDEFRKKIKRGYK